MRRFASILACGFALALVGCADSHDKVAADSLDVVSDMNGILEGVKDKASADAAKPKIEALGDRMQEIKARSEKLGAPSPEQQKSIQEKYKERIDKETTRISENMRRIVMNPETIGVLEAMMAVEPPPMLGSGPPPGAGDMQIPIGGGPEMENPFEGAENPFGNDNPFGGESPFGAEGGPPAFPVESQPPADNPERSADDPE